MDKRSKMLANDSIGSLLFRLSLPASIGMIVQALYNVVDAIFVGRGVGAMGIAGIAIGFPIQLAVMAIAQTIGIGAASIVSRSLGAKNLERAEKTMGNAFSFAFILGTSVMIFGLIFIDPLLAIFGSTQTILPYAKAYLSVILFGSIFITFNMAMNNIVRAEGNAKVAMGTMLVGAITNMILDPIFIFGFHMGIKGAALATVIAQGVTFVWLMYYFLKGKSVMRFHIRHLKPDKGIATEAFAIGASSSVRQISGSVLVAILNHTLAIYGGDISIAIFALVNRLSMFALMPAFGVAQGFQPIAGFSYGAKRYDRTKKSLYLAIIVATIITTAGFLVMVLFPSQLIGLFTTDQDLIASGIMPLRIIVLTFPFVGFMVVVSTLFQAIGKPVQALILSMARQIIFLIPLIFILPRFFKLNGVWYSFPLADFLTMMLTVVLFIREVRTMKEKIEGILTTSQANL